MIWIAVFLGLFLSQQRLDMINADGDACWHLRSGLWIIEHRDVMRADSFLHPRCGATVYTHDWLSELAMAGAWKAFGWNGVTLLAAALIASTLWLVHRQLLAEGAGVLPATGIVLLISSAVSIHWLARPLLVTHLMVVLFAWTLRAFGRGSVSPTRLCATLVPLMIVWVNAHGAFPIGLVLIGMVLAGNLVGWTRSEGGARAARLSRVRTLALLAVACSLATLVNPNGWRLPVHIAHFLDSPLLNAVTFEFRSPDFHNGKMTGFLLIWLAFLLVFAIARPRLGATDLILLGGWTLLSLRALRNVPVFALVAAPILAEQIGPMIRSWESVAWVNWIRARSVSWTLQDRRAGNWFWILLCLVIVLGMLVFQSPRLPVTGLSAGSFPVRAVDFLRTHPDSVHGAMFNEYDWGGYLELMLPERRVFIDGRNDIYGEELLREYRKRQPGCIWR